MTRLENGPPVGFPVQFRVIGEDKAAIRALANEVAGVMRANPWTRDVNVDWEEASRVIRLAIDQDRARVLGISTQELAQYVGTVVSGQAVTSWREKDKQVDVVVRGDAAERQMVSLLKDLAVPVGRGRTVPLAQIARLDYGFEQGIFWRRDRTPVITVRADIRDGVQAPVVSAQVNEKLAAIRARLPIGYRIDTGGAVEDSGKGQRSIAVVAPVMVLVMVTALMLQLQSFPRLAMVLLTAPLGLIGVTAALLVSRMPFGFVAMLGTIALAGMIMRNSVILVDQIDHDIRDGSRAVGGDRRRDGAPLPPHHAHRGRGRAGHDPAHAQRLLRADGGGDHGRAPGGHRADARVPAGPLRGVVPGVKSMRGQVTLHDRSLGKVT